MSERIYPCKDAEMLMASLTISNSLTANLAELAMARSTWTEAYATGLTSRIESASETYLGLDKKKGQRDATAYLNSISQTALRNLAFIKTQIEVDFSAEAPEILKSLGYPNKMAIFQNGGHQEELIELLFGFKKGMTASLKNHIVEKGTNPQLIDTLIGYATGLQQANLSQESLKQSSQIVSEDALSAFNSLYQEIIGICKIASSFYQDEPLKKDQFTFSKVLSATGGSSPKKETETPAQ